MKKQKGERSLVANYSLWPTGNYCILACGQIIPFGREAKFSSTPELKSCTPARVKDLP